MFIVQTLIDDMKETVFRLLKSIMFRMFSVKCSSHRQLQLNRDSVSCVDSAELPNTNLSSLLPPPILEHCGSTHIPTFPTSTATLFFYLSCLTCVWIHIRLPLLLLPSHSQSRPLPLSPPPRRSSSSTTTPPRPAPPPRPTRSPPGRRLRAPASRSR